MKRDDHEIRLPLKKLSLRADLRIRRRLWWAALQKETLPALLSVLRSPALLTAAIVLCLSPMGYQRARGYVYDSPQMVHYSSLYKWKRSMELAELKQKKNPVNRANYYLLLSKRRLQEADVLLAPASTAFVPQALAQTKRKDVLLSVGDSPVGGLFVESAQFVSLSLQEALAIAELTEQALVLQHAETIIQSNEVLIAMLQPRVSSIPEKEVLNSVTDVYRAHRNVVQKKQPPPTAKNRLATVEETSPPVPLASDATAVTADSVPYNVTLGLEAEAYVEDDEDDEDELLEIFWIALPDDEREEHLSYYEEIEDYEDDEWDYDEDEHEDIEQYEEFDWEDEDDMYRDRLEEVQELDLYDEGLDGYEQTWPEDDGDEYEQFDEGEEYWHENEGYDAPSDDEWIDDNWEQTDNSYDDNYFEFKKQWHLEEFHYMADDENVNEKARNAFRSAYANLRDITDAETFFNRLEIIEEELEPYFEQYYEQQWDYNEDDWGNQDDGNYYEQESGYDGYEDDINMYDDEFDEEDFWDEEVDD